MRCGSVGVIGGLGPATTAHFYLDILFSFKKLSSFARPRVVMSSVPLPYHIEEDLILHNRGVERYVPYLVSESLRLERAGVDFIVLPCNSLHIYIEEIRAAVPSTPVLSIVDESVLYLKQNGYSNVGLLATTNTLEGNLYKPAFNGHSLDYLVPSPSEQELLSTSIFHLAAQEKVRYQDQEIVFNILDSFLRNNADAALLACTDLQRLDFFSYRQLHVVDTMKVLVDATVSHLLKHTG